MKKIILAALVILGGRTIASAQMQPLAPIIPMPVSMAETAAGKIKAEEAGVKNRRAAVRYLGTVDWHYYPEAEAALVAALRADRNEQVRIDAAQAMGLHLCTKKGLDALNLVVTGGEQDGNPAEISDKVKAAANLALQHSQPKIAAPVPSAKPLFISHQQTAPAALQLTGYQVERAFAETFGAPKASQNIPELPRQGPRASGVSGLTPIGIIPRD